MIGKVPDPEEHVDEHARGHGHAPGGSHGVAGQVDSRRVALWTTDVPRLVDKLQKLIPKVGEGRRWRWEAWIAEERWDEFVEDILINHYDTAYAQAAQRVEETTRRRSF